MIVKYRKMILLIMAEINFIQYLILCPAALVVFIINGKVIWGLGLVAGIFSIAGHFLGAKAFVKNGTKIARPVVIGVLAVLLIKVIADTFGRWSCCAF